MEIFAYCETPPTLGLIFDRTSYHNKGERITRMYVNSPGSYCTTSIPYKPPTEYEPHYDSELDRFVDFRDYQSSDSSQKDQILMWTGEDQHQFSEDEEDVSCHNSRDESDNDEQDEESLEHDNTNESNTKKLIEHDDETSVST